MSRYLKPAERFFADEDGAALVEYALLVALIAIICILGITTLGQKINTKFTDIGTSLP